MSPCLLLHGIGEPPAHIADMERPYWLTTEIFARIVELAQHNDVRLTLDDGNDTDVHIALPALLRAGLTASFFIPSDRIGRPGYVSEDDIRTLQVAGMEIGSHGRAHIRWTEVSDDVIAEDVSSSIDRLREILGERVRGVAVPYGACDRRVLRVLRALHVERVYSSFAGPDPKDAWLVRRDCLMADMPAATIERLMTRKYTAVDGTLSFLRTWRRAGEASMWRA
ncbi:MAG: polysaccharide deacetylase family protein [Alphaproteobacteria bacterium]|nr:polysaccharide deacetylase family protein [Alphaproteobacteria bacterium]MDE2110239.1 polysaccharide deacetylase family protein [Alphaproteobacteria bacterium]